MTRQMRRFIPCCQTSSILCLPLLLVLLLPPFAASSYQGLRHRQQQQEEPRRQLVNPHVAVAYEGEHPTISSFGGEYSSEQSHSQGSKQGVSDEKKEEEGSSSLQQDTLEQSSNDTQSYFNESLNESFLNESTTIGEDEEDHHQERPDESVPSKEQANSDAKLPDDDDDDDDSKQPPPPKANNDDSKSIIDKQDPAQVPFQKTPPNETSTSNNNDDDSKYPDDPESIQLYGVPKTRIVVPAADIVIPATIEYDTTNGNLARMQAGDILGIHNVAIPTDGLYRIEARVCNPLSVGSFWLYDPASTQVLLDQPEVIWTRDWASWATIKLGLLRLQATDSLDWKILIRQGGFNLQFISVTLVEPEMAFFFKPAPPVPHHVVAATAYTAATPNVATEAPLGGLPNVGSIKNGEALDYDLTLSQAGLLPGRQYAVELAVSSPTTRGNAWVVDRDTHQVRAELSEMPETGGWYSWRIVALPGSVVTAPDRTSSLSLQIECLQGGFNFLFFTLSLLPEDDQDEAGGPPDEEDILFEATGVHGNDDDDRASPDKFFFWAGDAEAIHGMATVETNTGGDLSGGPGPLGNLHDDDWFTYRFQVPAAGSNVSTIPYNVSIRMASGWSGGGIEFRNTLDDSDGALGSILDMESTLGWQSWRTVRSDAPLKLPAGEMVELEVRVVKGGWNFLYFTLERAQ